MADERFTSKMAFQTMIDAGLKKKDRQNKELVDTISATIIFVILCLYLLIVIFPYFWTIIASIKEPAAINHPLDFNFTPTPR